MLEFLFSVCVFGCLWVGSLVFLCDEDDIAFSIRLTGYALLYTVGAFFGLVCLGGLLGAAWKLISAA